MKSVITEDLRKDAENKEKSIIQEGLELYEKFYAQKYPKLGEAFNDPQKALRAAQTCILLENQRQYLSKLDEAVVTAKFGEIAPKILDILRISYPLQVAHELVSVQTMKSIHDLIYFIRPVYSKTKAQSANPIAEGTEAFGKGAAQYSSEDINDTVTANYNDTDTDLSTTASYTPIRPKTVTLYGNDALIASDDGNGKITGKINIGGTDYNISGTINYNNGSFSAKVLGVNAQTVTFQLSYKFDSEQAPDRIGGVDIVFSTFPVYARPHKLDLRWSVDAALAASTNIGLDVEDQISIFAAQELVAQQDMSLVEDLIRVAGPIDTDLQFDARYTGQYYPEYMHAQGLRKTFGKVSNKILTTTGRGEMTWLIVSPEVEAYMSYLDGYVQEVNTVPIGVYRVGTFRGIPVYKYTWMKSGEFLGGFKGTMFGDAGYVLAKYIEVYATPTLEFSDFIGRKGIASFYDKKVIVPTYYKRGKVLNL